MNVADGKAKPRTDRVRVRRMHQRGHYDRASIDAVLDAGMVCHLGYMTAQGPVVMPTLYWREGDHVYWHGSAASQTLRTLAPGAQVCLTVTHMDGLVLARSGFHHSANFRSAVLFGNAEAVTDPDEVLARLKTFMEGIVPGRWDTIRPVTAQELKATTLLRLAIDEASAKIRTGGPVDDEEDYVLPIWSGVVPITAQYGTPVPDPRNLPEVALPTEIAAMVGRPYGAPPKEG